MKRILGLSLVFIASGGLFSCKPSHKLTAVPSAISSSPKEEDLQYESYLYGKSVVHTLLIPASSHFLITPALSPSLSRLESLAQKHHAIAAINGGYFDPENRKSTAIVVQQGVLVGDPRQNERLMHNPKLAPYLKQILNRTEFRRFRCGQTTRYDIALHSEPSPIGCRLVDALGGGPRLLPKVTLVQERFADAAKGKVIRDPLGSSQPNARSAIGITRDGSILLVMVAQRPQFPLTSGMSLPALAAFMRTLGVEKAMNLDGGSSSCLYYKGKTVYGKVNEKGRWVKRELLSILLIQKINKNTSQPST